jgi:hypothetical protein
MSAERSQEIFDKNIYECGTLAGNIRQEYFRVCGSGGGERLKTIPLGIVFQFCPSLWNGRKFKDF